MSQSKFFIFYIVLIFYCSSITAEEELKILYVDLNYVYSQSDLKERVEKETNQKRKSIETIREEARNSLREDKKYLKRLELLLGYEEYATEYRQLYQKKFELKEKELEKLNEELNLWRKEKESGVFEELLLAIETIAEKEKAKIVFHKRGSIVYADSSLDVSDQVIDLLNEINQRSLITVK